MSQRYKEIGLCITVESNPYENSPDFSARIHNVEVKFSSRSVRGFGFTCHLHDSSKMGKLHDSEFENFSHQIVSNVP